MNVVFANPPSKEDAADLHDVVRDALKSETVSSRLEREVKTEKGKQIEFRRKMSDFLPTVGSTLILKIKNHGDYQITRIGTAPEAIEIIKAEIIGLPQKRKPADS